MWTSTRLREDVGIVFQSFNLFPHMTVLDNVTLAPTKVLDRPTVMAEERAMQLLRRIGLEEKAQEYPDRLSGGQQQRVAIVRALAMEPAAPPAGRDHLARSTPSWSPRC